MGGNLLIEYLILLHDLSIKIYLAYTLNWFGQTCYPNTEWTIVLRQIVVGNSRFQYSK